MNTITPQSVMKRLISTRLDDVILNLRIYFYVKHLQFKFLTL